MKCLSTTHFFAQPGDSTDLSVQILERLRVTVDENGGLCFMLTRLRVLTPRLVGTILGPTDPLADKCPNSTTPPTIALTPGEIQHREMDRMSLPEPRLSPPPGYPPQSLPGGIQEVTSDACGTVLEFNAPARDNSAPDRFHVENQSSLDATPEQKGLGTT